MAIIASLLLAMSVLVIVTVMFKTMQSELQATKLNGSQLRRHYLAKAALADVVIGMGENTDWMSLTYADPIVLDSYGTPVHITYRLDPYNASVYHVKAECEGESAYRVVRAKADGEGLVFAARSADPGANFYRMARQLNARRQEGGPEDGDGESPWRPISPPPPEVYSAGGTVVPFAGSTTRDYTADYKGNFYSALSGPQGFAVYKYAGSGGWERLPTRPAARYTAAGAVPDSGAYTNPGDEPILFAASKDGKNLSFVENVPPEAGYPNGASYLQTLNLKDETWTIDNLPKIFTLSSNGTYQVDDIAVGDTGHAFLLTKPTTDHPFSRILSQNAGTWNLIDSPATDYYSPSGSLLASSGPMPVESLAVDVNNHLLVTSPTAFPEWYAVSRLQPSGWEMGTDTPDLFNNLTHRDFQSSSGFASISADSIDSIVVGSPTSTMQGRPDTGFNDIYKLPGRIVVNGGSRIGGGLRALKGTGYRTTAEY